MKLIILIAALLLTGCGEKTAPTPRKPVTVPEGYALISIDALKAWGKYDEVLAACQYGITGEQT